MLLCLRARGNCKGGREGQGHNVAFCLKTAVTAGLDVALQPTVRIQRCCELPRTGGSSQWQPATSLLRLSARWHGETLQPPTWEVLELPRARQGCAGTKEAEGWRRPGQPRAALHRLLCTSSLHPTTLRHTIKIRGIVNTRLALLIIKLLDIAKLSKHTRILKFRCSENTTDFLTQRTVPCFYLLDTNCLNSFPSSQPLYFSTFA